MSFWGLLHREFPRYSGLPIAPRVYYIVISHDIYDFGFPLGGSCILRSENTDDFGLVARGWIIVSSHDKDDFLKAFRGCYIMSSPDITFLRLPTGYRGFP